MKIERSTLKKSTSEVPHECSVIIESIKSCQPSELSSILKQHQVWLYGKCELYHWIDVLDIFDEILCKCCHKEESSLWTIFCDKPENEKVKDDLLLVLHFTALLIEHSFTRHLYNSMEHLAALLSSSDMSVVLAVLHLLYVFSKRSNFLTKLASEKKQVLVQRLTHLAESWGGKENGFGLAECCQDLGMDHFPINASTLHFEFYTEQKDEKQNKKSSNVLTSIHLENVDKISQLSSEIMERLLQAYNIPVEKQISLFTHIRLAHTFSQFEKRLQSVQARLQSISILIYSSAMTDNVNTLIYSGFIEELVDILQLPSDKLLDIKATALRTLTSIFNLERNPKVGNIIEATGAASYHAFLPVLVRNCIQHMTSPDLEPFPQPFTTALFSFLYHLASFETGGDALVSCGMIESLLKVIQWCGEGHDHITFVTRAVRVVDLITNLNMQAFQTHGGLAAFIFRLGYEVEMCRKEVPYEINLKATNVTSKTDEESVSMETESDTATGPSEEKSEIDQQTGVTIARPVTPPKKDLLNKAPNKHLQCFPQRAALLKSMLNFLKKAITDPSFTESIRHLMDGSLPSSLKHIISNAEYYGASLFLLATDVVAVYVFQEPSLLSSLQENGLTDVVLHALLVKDVPATREVLASLPNVFSALCLNAQGLESFVKCKPFDQLFKVLLSSEYLVAMRRRRASDPLGDTASNLGSAMDELMRNQPSLRSEATKAIIRLLEEVCIMGRNQKFICQNPSAGTATKSDLISTTTTAVSSINNDAESSSDEDEEEDMPSNQAPTATSTHLSSSADLTDHLPQANQSASSTPVTMEIGTSPNSERTPIPLMDYVLNVMKFIESILSNNTTDDHCREFVNQGGLSPLLNILGLPNLPIDFPSTPACLSVASVCKSILTLTQSSDVLKQGLSELSSVLASLKPLHQFLPAPGGSILLNELAHAPLHPSESIKSCSATPLLHSLSAAHSYITMFTQICKISQTDIRAMCVAQWGFTAGLRVLRGLRHLYTSLVWESSVLLALCNEEDLPPDSLFGRQDLKTLIQATARASASQSNAQCSSSNSSLTRSCCETGSNGMSAAMQALSTADQVSQESSAPGTSTNTSHDRTSSSSMSAMGRNLLDLLLNGTSGLPESATEDAQKSSVSQKGGPQFAHIKPLLLATSRLGRALADLFGLLVKLCVGTPVRQRRGHLLTTPVTPSSSAQAMARSLSRLLASGLSWKPPDFSSVPKLRLTFYICSVGFTSPMLFDEKKFPYHLMLQKFIWSGGQDALFDAFYWALSCGGSVSCSEGLENPSLPAGTGEFLNDWLTLVEKMVSTRQILDSPHTLPKKVSSQPNYRPFDPLLYLIHIHKIAFEAIMFLWNKNPLKVYGASMSESILSILSHIIKGEAIIKAEKAKQSAATSKTSTSKSSSSGASTSTAPASGSSTGNGSTSSTSRPRLPQSSFSASNYFELGPPDTSDSSAPPAVENISPPDEPSVNPEHLQQLTEMGFERAHCIDALNHTSSLSAATEYLLTHPAPIVASAASAAAESVPAQPLLSTPAAASSGASTPQIMNMDVDMSVEDQMIRAIAISLGAPVNTDEKSQNSKEKSSGSTDTVDSEDECDLDANELQKDESYISKDVLDDFTNSILPGCLNLLDKLPETVYRVCDLLVIVSSRNGSTWQQETLTNLVAEIAELSLHIDESCRVSEMEGGSDELSGLADSEPLSCRLANRLHLLTLLFQEMKTPCAETIEVSGVLDLLISVLEKATYLRSSVTKKPATPKWVAPLVLLLDLYEKVLVSNNRRSQLSRIIGPTHTWKWFDDRLGRWSSYSAANNKIIDDAYRAGEVFVKFTAGRRRYLIQFITMVQINEETGNRRPIMLSLPSSEKSENKTSGTKSTDDTKSETKQEPAATEAKQESTAKETKQTEIKSEPVVSQMEVEDNLLVSHSDNFSLRVVRTCVKLIEIPAEPETLHAVLRLTLRLTRDQAMASEFTVLGGARHLLRLSSESVFRGYTTLAILILRHIMEDESTLKHTLEKVVRMSTGGTGSTADGVAQGSIGSKEKNYVFRVLSPAACRTPAIFKQAAENYLRITAPGASKRGEDESLLMASNIPHLLKALPLKSPCPVPPVNEGGVSVINDLLDSLILRYSAEPQSTTADDTSRVNLTRSKSSVIDVTNPSAGRDSTGRTSSVPEALHTDSTGVATHDSRSVAVYSDAPVPLNNNTAPPTAMELASQKPEVNSPAESQPKKLPAQRSQPILRKSAILRLLSEFVRSYSGCVTHIMQYQYRAEPSNLLAEDCSSMAFILDNLLVINPQLDSTGDKDHTASVGVLVASIAACSNNPDAQLLLVTEVKMALQRALALSDSELKHTKIQALTVLVTTMMESCPSPVVSGQPPNQVFKGQQAMAMNNIVRAMVKRGIVTDLARISHSLDLSSPHIAMTMNHVLKPLESLARIVNQPQSLSIGNKYKGKSLVATSSSNSASTSSQPSTSAAATSNSNATEVSNTVVSEASVLATEDGGADTSSQLIADDEHEALECHDGDEPVVHRDEAEVLQHVIDRVLGRESGNNPEQEVIADILMEDDSATPVSRSRSDINRSDMSLSDQIAEIVNSVYVEGNRRDEENRSDSGSEDNESGVAGDESFVDEEEEDEDVDEEEEDDEEGEEEDENSSSDMDEGGDDDDDDDYDDDGDDLLDGSYIDLDTFMSRMQNENDELYLQLEDMLPDVSLGNGTNFFIPEGAGTAPATSIAIAVRPSVHGSYQDDTGITANGAAPPPPSDISTTHPLLIRHSEAPPSSNPLTRIHRGGVGGRQRGFYRYNPGNPTLHLQYNNGSLQPITTTVNTNPLLEALLAPSTNSASGNTNPLLEALLAPSSNAANDVLQLANTLGGGSSLGGFQTFQILANQRSSSLGLNNEDGLLQDQLMERNNASGHLSSVPSALDRWADEARVLDGESMHDCVTVLKSQIFAVLDKYLEGELEEQKAKRKQAEALEKAAKAKEDKAKEKKNKPADSSTTDSTSAAADVASSSTEDTNTETVSSAQSSLPETSASNTTVITGSNASLQSNISTISPHTSAAVPVPISSGEPVFEFETPLDQVTNTATPSAPLRPVHPFGQLEALGSNTTFTPGIADSTQTLEPSTDLTPAPTPDLCRDLNPSLTTPFTETSSSTAFSNTESTPAPQVSGESAVSETPENTPDLTSVAAPLTPVTPSFDPMDMSAEESEQLNQQSVIGSSSVSVEPAELVSDAREQPSGTSAVNSSAADIETRPAEQNNLSAEVTSMDASVAMETAVIGDDTVVSSESSGPVSTESAASTSSSISTTVATSSTSSTPSNIEPDVPEGIDPSFLAALPENVRQEVIAEQLRLQRIQQRAQQQQQEAEALGVPEVNAEYLAALPPAMQEEVLAQQHAEQARIANQQNLTVSSSGSAQATGESSNTLSNISDMLDPSAFISSLPPTLRNSVLSDIDDSMMAVLSPSLALEAQNLRRDFEERHQRILRERYFSQVSRPPLSDMFRISGRSGGSRYRIPPNLVPTSFPVPSGYPWRSSSNSRSGASTSVSAAQAAAGAGMRLRGRHLLDQESLVCLLVLLFVDEPSLNTARLHRVFRNLAYHPPTRSWLIRALLVILQRTSESKSNATGTSNSKPVSLAGSSISTQPSFSSSAVNQASTDVNQSSTAVNQTDQSMHQSVGGQVLTGQLGHPSWLSVSLDAALGCRANVFQVDSVDQESSSQSSSSARKQSQPVQSNNVYIHPQACPFVCRHVLDTLISLAKSFPGQFLPSGAVPLNTTVKNRSTPAAGSSTPAPSTSSQHGEAGASSNEFWELLMRLDQTSGTSKKGKHLQKGGSSTPSSNPWHDEESRACLSQESNLDSAPIGLLMSMLAHPVVRRSQPLTDRLLRLLALISLSLNDLSPASAQKATVESVLSNARQSSTSLSYNSSGPRSTASTVPLSTAGSGSGSTSHVVPVPHSLTTTSAISEPLVASNTENASCAGSAHLSTSSSPPADLSSKGSLNKVESKQETSFLENQLHLAIEVLTSKSCSEEGLEDATTFLLQLSRTNGVTRDNVLRLLLQGGIHIGNTVCQHIRQLLDELRVLNADLRDSDLDDSPSTSKGVFTPKGTLTSRFGGVVVVNAQKKSKPVGGRELQLPSMVNLTCKTSSQRFLLRILKVIIQLRDAARLASGKTQLGASVSDALSGLTSASETLSGLRDAASNLTETIAMLEAEVDSIMDTVAQPASTAASSTPALTESVSTPARPETPMDVDQPAAASSSAGTSESALLAPVRDPVDVAPVNKTSSSPANAAAALPRLSEQLPLDELWEVLGACLTELSRTPDHHAVLVLQPAVEAFFLVHAGEKSKEKDSNTSSSHGQPQQSVSGASSSTTATSSSSRQLSHLELDPMDGPASPSTSAADSAESGSHLSLSTQTSTTSDANLPPDTAKFLKFAETHHTVLNQILRQSSVPLSDGPFSVLVHHTRILDFDVKRRYFRQELEKLDEGIRREDLAVHVKRQHVFEDSFRELFRRSAEEWKNRFYIVFEGEDGQDAGGLLREWYVIVSREIFNPMYALFCPSPGDRATHTINPSSHCNSNHLHYFKFVGRIIAKAIFDNKLLECYFTRSFYKHILGVNVRFLDMESEDYSFYQGLVFLMEHNVSDLGYEPTFSTEIQEFGVTEVRDLKPNGRNIAVTEENKKEYVRLVCQMRMTGAIRRQLDAFLDGFYDIIPKCLISIFNEQELELLLSGLPNIDIDDLKSTTEYHKYQATSLQIQWFWRALRSFDQADRARFLQFVTGTSKVPLQGFAFLEGMNGVQKFQIHRDDRSTDRLPSAHTCFNQLDLPAYETYDKLKKMLQVAIHECSEGFGLA